MNTFLFFAGIYIVLLLSMPIYRVVVGPTVFDRLIAASLVGTNTTLLLVFIGFGYARIDMFIDLAIVYAFLNFVGTVAASKYLERGRRAK